MSTYDEKVNGVRRTRQLCRDCERGSHAHHRGIKCMEIVAPPPRDFVCLCREGMTP